MSKQKKSLKQSGTQIFTDNYIDQNVTLADRHTK